MIKLTLLCFISALMSFKLMAAEQILCTVDNDDDARVYKLVVSYDEATLTLKELYKDSYVQGKKSLREVLNAEDLKKSHGIIMERKDKHNVLNLKSNNFDHDQGGLIIVDTLFNGVNGDRKNYELDLVKDQSTWKLFKNNKPISRFHVRVHKVVVVGVVGIKNIIME
jgi:hypothetical protein